MSFDDSSHLPTLSQESHGPSQYPTASTSTTAASGVLFLILVYYILHYLDYTNLPLSGLLWNSLVYSTPSRLISALDSGFEKTRSEEQDSTEKGFDSKGHASKSNAMRRILSLDGTGVMTVVQRTRALSDLGSMFKVKPQNSLPGLGNWDHSCYQNSVLQGLASLKCLPKFLQRFGSSAALVPTKTALQALTSKLNDPENIGKTFWTPAELKSMSSWEQQDAQEYFSKVMDELDKDTAKSERHKASSAGLEALAGQGNTFVPSDELKTMSETGRLVTSRLTLKTMLLPEELLSVMARNPLEGLLAQRVGCQQCGYVEGLSLVPFNCLTVPLGKQWMYDVRECLDEYTALEPIHGVECTKCTLLRTKVQMEQILSGMRHRVDVEGGGSDHSSSDGLEVSAQQRLNLVKQALDENQYSDSVLKMCQIPAFNRVLATKSRQAVIARAPRAMVIHINRSIFEELTGEQSKNQATVRFPRQFELGPWCLGHGKTNDNSDIESWNVDPNESMLFRKNDMRCVEGKIYELRAVVTHFGKHENGHYICYRKTPYTAQEHKESSPGVHRDSKSWWRLSDEEVTEVSEENVLAQGGVFMLFYEQISEGNTDSEPLDSGELVANTANEPSTPCAAEEATRAADTQTLPTGRKAEENGPLSANAVAAPVPSDLLPVIPAGDSKLPTDEPPMPTLMEITSAVPSPPAINTPPTNTLFPTPEDTPSPSDSLPKESPLSVTPLTRTISPRTGTGSGKRAGQAMETVAGFVQAN